MSNLKIFWSQMSEVQREIIREAFKNPNTNKDNYTGYESVEILNQYLDKNGEITGGWWWIPKTEFEEYKKENEAYL